MAGLLRAAARPAPSPSAKAASHAAKHGDATHRNFLQMRCTQRERGECAGLPASVRSGTPRVLVSLSRARCAPGEAAWRRLLRASGAASCWNAQARQTFNHRSLAAWQKGGAFETCPAVAPERLRSRLRRLAPAAPQGRGVGDMWRARPRLARAGRLPAALCAPLFRERPLPCLTLSCTRFCDAGENTDADCKQSCEVTFCPCARPLARQPSARRSNALV